MSGITTTPGPLTTLAQIVLGHAQAIDAAYASQEGGFPSLNDPQYPYAPHPLENNPKMKYSTMLLSAAAQQLLASVIPVMSTLFFDAMDGFPPVALGIIEEHNIADILRQGPAEGVPVEEIAAKAGISDPSKLSKVLRYLASRHIFREVQPNVFANTRISSALAKGLSLEEIRAKPEAQYEKSPSSAGVAMMYDGALKSLPYFSHWFTAPSDGDNKTPFEMALGMTPWEHHNSDPVARRRFALAMSTFGDSNPEFSIATIKSLNLKKGDTVVDVGANTGSLCRVLAGNEDLKALELKYVVQDTDKVIENAERYWKTEEPELFATGAITLQVQDFFTPQACKNAPLYILRHILHDWNKPKSITIMKHLRSAASSASAETPSRLVIFESIVPYACKAPENAPFANTTALPGVPPVLLPNLGNALGGMIMKADLLMGVSHDGQERTVADFTELGEATGWKLENVLSGGRVCALVFCAV